MARKTFPLTLLITALLGFFAISYAPRETDRQFIRHVVPPVLLVIAHPDDEVMFFAPSILSLISHRIDLRVLCLSIGEFAPPFAKRQCFTLNFGYRGLGGSRDDP